jgi:hypothetical protein
MAVLTRAQILEVKDFPEAERVPVPEWGGDVLIRSMSASERDLYEQDLVAARVGDKDTGVKVTNVRARLLAFVIVDEKGNLLFSEDDIVALGKKSIVAVDRVFARAQKMNALTQADVEALEKNSESDQTDSSSST